MIVLTAKGASLLFPSAHVGMVQESWRENMMSTRLKLLHNLEMPSVSSPRASLKLPVSIIFTWSVILDPQSGLSQNFGINNELFIPVW
jgi:hypothetical protein